MNKYNICVIGLGYVGLTLSVAFSLKGVKVHGIEKSNEIINSLNSKKAHFQEIGINDHIESVLKDELFSYGNALPKNLDFNVYIITVGTPLGDNDKPNYNYISEVANIISKILKNEDLVVLRSTVSVGVTRNIIKPILDSSKVKYSLAFCPERTLEGDAINELFTLPQVVSGIDANSISKADELFSILSQSIVKVSSVEAAEMVKLVCNCQRDTLFALSNEIAILADTAGLSGREIIKAANFEYKRSFLSNPGLVGGPCLEKDFYIMSPLYAKNASNLNLMGTARKLNEGMPAYAINKIIDLLNKNNIQINKIRKIAILGLAFKGRPETSDLRGSLVYKVIDNIRNVFLSADIVGHDFVVDGKEGNDKLGIECTASVEESFEHSNVVIIQNNHLLYNELNFDELSLLMEDGGIIYDFWGLGGVHSRKLNNNVIYCGFGMMGT